MSIIGKKLCSYDESCIEDWDDFDEVYKDTCYIIGKVLLKKFPSMCAKVLGQNLDWRNSSGSKFICLDEHYATKKDWADSNINYITELGIDLIRAIAPKTTDFSFECFNYKGGKGLFIRLYHHDCPTGSCFYITPCAKSTYERYA